MVMKLFTSRKFCDGGWAAWIVSKRTPPSSLAPSVRGGRRRFTDMQTAAKKQNVIG